jgi:hypothetical protein
VRQEECESHFLTLGGRVIELALERGSAVVGLNHRLNVQFFDNWLSCKANNTLSFT